MFEKLLQIFSGSPPLEATGKLFSKMQGLVRDMVQTASGTYWGLVLTEQDRRALFETDMQVNALQREIRKQLAYHLAGAASANAPQGLLLMSLIKDIERLGDYAKNLSEVHALTGIGAGDLPDGELRNQLRQIAGFVEAINREFTQVCANQNQHRAHQLMVEGKKVSRACDDLVRSLARSNLSAQLAVNMTLATRYYKRISGHLVNVLSSVVMPLHQLDYMSEDMPPSVPPPRS
jgi:phosphate transport system protein